MKNRIIFSSVVFFCIAISGCLISCVSRNSYNVSNADELGDTVPASEFQVVEDTVSATVANDSVAAPVKNDK